jgi:hypothetical protein
MSGTSISLRHFSLQIPTVCKLHCFLSNESISTDEHPDNITFSGKCGKPCLHGNFAGFHMSESTTGHLDHITLGLSHAEK